MLIYTCLLLSFRKFTYYYDSPIPLFILFIVCFSWYSGIFEILIGFLGILSFVILSVNGKSVKKWIIAFITCIYLVTDGIINIKKFIKK